jgi:molybdopterin synthase sulfur carrier subunit
MPKPFLAQSDNSVILKESLLKDAVNGRGYRRRLVKMIVNYYATLRQVVGKRQVNFVLPQGGTLRQLVEEMVKRYPGLKNEMLDTQGNLYGHIHIFVNGRDSTILEGSLDSILEPDDTISIFPPVGGG